MLGMLVPALGGEGEVPHLVRKFLAFRMVVQVYPINMLFGGVRVRDFLPDADLHLKGLARLDLRRSGFACAYISNIFSEEGDHL